MALTLMYEHFPKKYNTWQKQWMVYLRRKILLKSQLEHENRVIRCVKNKDDQMKGQRESLVYGMLKF